jgi:glycosyltransferase involved in cell wall biosynthesis
MIKSNKVITIAIPTYNRAKKVERLLRDLHKTLIDENLYENVCILVSDNNSEDNTESLIKCIDFGQIDFQYYKQERNLGFDQNVLFLYEAANSDYVWLFSDDDIPLPGAILKIFNFIFSHKNDIILFSFMQPPGSNIRQFNYSKLINVITDPKLIIKDVIKMPKLSIYVLKKYKFSNEERQILSNSIGDGWMFIMLSFSILDKSINPSLVIFSEQLAMSDDEYHKIWVPTPFLWLYKIALHPFVKKHSPELENQLREDGYRQCIIFSWALITGKLTLDDKDGLINFIKNLDWRLKFLLKNPKLLLMMLLMKSKLLNYKFYKVV